MTPTLHRFIALLAFVLFTLFCRQTIAQTPQWSGPPSSFTRTKFQSDYAPGTNDVNGNFLGGTSCMYLVPHDNKLWAGIGYWNDIPGSDPTPGPQVIVKETASGAWKVDTSFGTDFLRVDALYSVTFARDKNGAPLNPPVTRLLASCTDITPPYEAHVWMRDPASLPGAGVWTMTTIPGVTGTERTYVRHMFMAVDAVTGVHNLFAGVSHSGSALYRGAWNAVTQAIEWDSTPELTGPKRVLSSAIANERLYVTAGTDGDANNTNGGLFRRVDGVSANPRWEFIYEWPGTGTAGLGKSMRGLTAVPRLDGQPGDLLIGQIENLERIVRIDPSNGHSVTDEMLCEDYFDTRWGANADFLYAAYNDTLWATDPANNERVLLMGLWVRYPGAYGTLYKNNAWFFIRHNNGEFEHAFLHDPAISIPTNSSVGLMGVRTIAPSPFAGEQGRVFYFGGGDAGGDTPWLHNAAWVYRGTLPDDTTPLNISGTTVTLTLGTTAGWNAQIQTSTDLTNWTNLGSAFVGNNAPRTGKQNISSQPRRFYRVQHTRTTP
jgi:hypothetical protein